jgi:hypothetical protein
MRNKKAVLALAALPVLGLGWYLFRPELLFVNQTVNEALPGASQSAKMVETFGKGTFASQAHETKGTAEVVEVDGKRYVQLKDFHTSNGPDVRIYLVKSSNTDAGEVLKSGFVDLGSIKGNIGDQSYEIPSDVNLDEHQVVSVWCKRFSVGFGAAKLEKGHAMRSGRFTFRTVGFAPTEVTFGAVKGGSSFAGKGAIIEDAGKRFVQVTFTKMSAGHTLRLVKKESLSVGAFPKGAEFVNLGEIKSKTMKPSISKSLDLWLYRSLAILDSSGKVVNFVNLRSAQEGGSAAFFA